MDDTPTFLTDQRRAVLTGEYDGSESSERTHKSLIRSRARTAIQELIAVADSGAIDNTEVFDPDQIYTLLSVLTVGLNTFQDSDGEPMNPDGPHYREVDRAYRNEILRGIDRLRLEVHGNDRFEDE